MPFNGSGTFSLTYSWVTEQASSPIEISKLDTQEQDIADALSNCILRDGTGKPTATIDWNGQDITGIDAMDATSLLLDASGGANSSALRIKSNTPSILLEESDGASNEKAWDLLAVSTQLLLRALLDDYSSAVNVIVIDRTGTTVNSIELGGPLKVYQSASDPTGSNGMIYYNTTTHKFKGYANGAWVDLH